MRYLLLLLLLAPMAHAAAPSNSVEPTAGVINQMSSTMTVSGMTVSHTAATSVVVSTAAAYRFVTVQNLCAGAAADLYCGENSTALATSGNGEGYLVSRGSVAYTFTLRPGMNFYCLAGGAADCQAAVIRGR